VEEIGHILIILCERKIVGIKKVNDSKVIPGESVLIIYRLMVMKVWCS
jgi:hypothetical protein